MVNILKYIQTKITQSAKYVRPAQSPIQSGGEEAIKSDSSERFTNEEIENTPFRLVGNKTQGYAATMGNYKITPQFKTMREVAIYLDNNHFNVIANMIVTLPAIMKQHATELQNEERVTA